MPEIDDSFPRMLAGRYRLEAKLGHGGMGVVYRATDVLIQRPVAVKLIRGEGGVEIDEEVAGRFLREAKNTARVQHEHIIEVFDLGRSETGDLFFVMELLEGESLSSRLRRKTRLSVDETVHIARQICAALEVAHQAGIIHRDLKPANVMLLSRAGDDAFVKVLDFGVAKSYSPDQQTDLTHTGMLVGTVEYMAPEQIMGKKVDGRTDVYALGVVLYRMLVGKPPYREAGVPAMIHWHLNVAPKSLNDTMKGIPSALDRVVLRCLAKRPEDRFPSMKELANALSLAISPGELGLVDLEYDSDANDPYAQADKTKVARPQPKTRSDDMVFDDATIKMDRTPSSESSARQAAPVAIPPVVPGVPRVAPPVDHDRTAVMSREDSTAKRSLPAEIRREAKPCAMCHTLNPPHVRACTACGVSLEASDQAAVRARVAAPHPVHAQAPQMPPPTSGAYVAGPQGPRPAHPVSGSHPQQQPPVQAAWPPAGPPAEKGSVWQRFLRWAGLRGR
jgi:serine/threonine-protein kinase